MVSHWSSPLPSSSELVDRIQEHASRIQTFEGWARLTVVSEVESFTASLHVAAKPPDSLWLKIEGPLGVDILTGTFSEDSVLLYSPWENVVYEGSVQRFQAFQILPFPVYSTDLIQSILGFPIPDNTANDAFLSLSHDSGQLLLSLGSQTRIWVDKKGPSVAKWEALDSSGDIIWTWSGEMFKRQKKVWLPRVIRFFQDNPRQRITLFYETVKINRHLKNQWSSIRIPEGVLRFEF
jgi:outer membrane lipoprotein-sorting protein